eukprot:CAMPEP_0195519224 /NCGR_PEP_ID=MMETSP0794_2-20130614/14526_1 /TAXON_ID=515487 /ORGANISM="Stephanopyxis turris, Strain CCMP 815" /LENGTH=434 /DNA_ID=CAMNT_0040648347 /DNA_START=26 /DNA_END=1330 /DNA_ORIENTATION=+
MVDFLGLLVALIFMVATIYYMTTKSKESTASRSIPSKEEGEEETAKTRKTQSKKKPSNEKKKTTTKKQQQQRVLKPAAHERYIRRFGGHAGDVLSMSVSPNGEWMATTGVDGQLRVSRVEKEYNSLFLRANIDNHDKICAMSWEGDNRTIACALTRAEDVVFYRIKKKAGDQSSSTSPHSFPYELVELVKRRFSTSSKLDEVSECVTDSSSTGFNLVLTSGDSSAKLKTKTVVAWDGKTGDALGSVAIGSGDVRLSRDGKFLCTRGGGKTTEIKVFEVLKKKIKGEIEPRFDKIPTKSVMTLIVKAKVVDVDFWYTNGVCDKAIVCCVDGTIQIWNLDVEYRVKEDPKLLCTTKIDKKIMMISSSFEKDRFVVATNDAMLHVYSYSSGPNPSISLDFTIERFHSEGVGDVQFCKSGNFLYSRGVVGKDVFAWKA